MNGNSFTADTIKSDIEHILGETSHLSIDENPSGIKAIIEIRKIWVIFLIIF